MTRTRTTRVTGTGLRDALAGGLVGATTLTAIHQAALRTAARPPRMDRVGLQAIARGMHAAGFDPPRGRRLYALTLAGDLVANTAYYALAAMARRHAIGAGAALGMAAGVGALTLPRSMGLDDPPDSDADNQAMTVAWYTIGGVAAGATILALRHWRTRRERKRSRIARVRTPHAARRRGEGQ